MSKFILMSMILILLASCAPKQFEPFEPEEITFNKTEEYSIKEDLENITKPSKINPIYIKYVDDNIEQLTNSTNATHILFTSNEYAKIGGLVKLAKTYKQLVLDQEVLVNTYISQINSLKELFAMEQQKAKNYRELWIISENLYRREKYDHQIDTLRNNIMNGLLLLSNIGLVILAF